MTTIKLYNYSKYTDTDNNVRKQMRMYSKHYWTCSGTHLRHIISLKLLYHSKMTIWGVSPTTTAKRVERVRLAAICINIGFEPIKLIQNSSIINIDESD